jgi:uncharacterized protein (TIGR00369 family)
VIVDLLKAARASGDFGPLVAAVPYARFLGITIEDHGGDLVCKLTYKPELIGNTLIPALHGGTMGALLESTAVFGLIRDAEIATLPRIVNITVEYLRSARAVDTFARAEIVRHGRRVVAVRALAWQEDRDRPIAAANAHFLVEPLDGP